MRTDRTKPAPRSGPRAYDVGVLNKAVDVLEALVAEGELGLTELSRATSANKASVYRILSTLENRGFVAKDPDTRRYSAGHRLIALSNSIVEAVDLVNVARPLLTGLREEFDETVNLAVLSDGAVQYLDVLEGSHGLRMTATVGTRHPLNSTGLGKAFLSRLDPAQARRMLTATKRPRLTPKTITSVDALLRELDRTRERGFAIDNEETEVGALCVAVAVVGKDGAPLAAISVAGPAARMNADLVFRIGERLRDAARALADRAGY